MSAIRKIRFAADKDALLWIADENGKKIAMGLLLNESLTGCNGVIREGEEIEKGKTYLVKPGEIQPLRAIVRWRKKIDDGVYRLGFEFID